MMKRGDYEEDFEALSSFSRIGAVPIIILTYLGFSLLVSGFVLTVLAYAPTDSYLMVMIQDMGIAGFVGPVALVIGLIIFVIGLIFCLCGKRDDDDD